MEGTFGTILSTDCVGSTARLCDAATPPPTPHAEARRVARV